MILSPFVPKGSTESAKGRDFPLMKPEKAISLKFWYTGANPMKHPEQMRNILEETRKRLIALRETVRRRAASVTERLRQALRGNGRYVGVAAVFLLAIWYNLVVVPQDGLKKDSQVGYDEFVENLVEPDIEGDRPSKTYADAFSSLPGDWYRIGIRARALDADETLRVLIVSEAGEEREVGRVALEKGDTERLSEFVFPTDGIYRDVIVRKEGETDSDRWHGGRILLPTFRVTRLMIGSEREAAALLPTMSRQGEPDRFIAAAVPGAGLPAGDFAGWGAFRMDGEKLFSVSFAPRSGKDDAAARFALELHRYDPESRTVSGEILASFPFGSKEMKKGFGKGGTLSFDIPGEFVSGDWYAFLVRRTGGDLTLAEIADDAGVRGPFLLSVRAAEADPRAERLLSGAIVEDLGPALRYEYRMSGTANDIADLADTSDTVTFDPDQSLVKGRAKEGEYFAYDVDTVYPFREIFIAAEQYGEYGDQIAMEYSFDDKEWTPIPYTQDEGEPQRFAGRIGRDAGSDRHSFRLRVRYAGDEDGKRDFALRSLRITGTLKKQ